MAEGTGSASLSILKGRLEQLSEEIERVELSLKSNEQFHADLERTLTRMRRDRTEIEAVVKLLGGHISSLQEDAFKRAHTEDEETALS